MRRLIAIALMLLLPLQSAWALVAMPCRGHVMAQAVAPAALAAALVEAHEGHGPQDGHHTAMGGHEHHPAADTGASAHQHQAHHAHHDTAPAADHGGNSSGGLSTQGPDNCSGSAACMSLHSPPLAVDLALDLPALALPSFLPQADGARFSSVPPQRLHRPPIGTAA